MLRLTDPDHARAVLMHAASLGEEAVRQLTDRMFRYAECADIMVEISPLREVGMAYSFGFTTFRLRFGEKGESIWEAWVSGGIIYDPSRKTWGVHT